MVPVDKRTTFKTLRRDLENEIRQGAVMGSDRLAYLLSSDMVKPEDDRAADQAVRCVYAAIRRDVKPAKRGLRYPFRDLNDADGDGESVYAYFVLSEIES